MNLSDIFPLQPKTPLRKRDVNILFAALYEREYKRLLFTFDNRAEPGFTTPTDANIGAFLGAVPGKLLYEDLIISNHQVNSSLQRIYWIAFQANIATYNDNDVIFSIKDFSLYFKSEGAWVKDTGQVIIQSSDKIVLRLLNIVQEFVLGNEFVFDSTNTIEMVDVLDLAYFLNGESPSQFGAYPIDGENLADGTLLGNRVTTDCDDNSTGLFSKTRSPHLIYTAPTTSSIYESNNSIGYVRGVTSVVSSSSINKNFLFIVSAADIATKAPEIAADYFFISLGSDDRVLYKESSFFQQKANLTASLMNFIYYCVSFYRYMNDAMFIDTNFSPFGVVFAISPIAEYLITNNGPSFVGSVTLTGTDCGFASGGIISATGGGFTASITVTTTYGVWRRLVTFTNVLGRAAVRANVFMDMNTALEIQG